MRLPPLPRALAGAAAGLPSLLLIGCATYPQPVVPDPVRPEGGVLTTPGGKGQVFYAGAEEAPAAAYVAHLIDEHFEATAERLGHRNPRPLEVWLDPSWDFSDGVTFDHCIVVSASNKRIEWAAIEWIVVHELVHWHASGSVVQQLPQPVVEGLCEWIAIDLVDRWGAIWRTWHDESLDAVRERGEMPLLMPRIGLDNRDWWALPNDEKHDLEALGFALVDRIGLDGLLEAAERGAVTPEAILELAGVPPDGSGLEVAPSDRSSLPAPAAFADWACTPPESVTYPERAWLVELSQEGARALASGWPQVGDGAYALFALDRYSKRVSQKLGCRNPRPVVVLIDPEWAHAATTFAGGIVLGPLEGPTDLVDLVLAHQLVHWHERGCDRLRNLPGPIAEGLCDRIAAELVEPWLELRRAQFGERLEDARERGELPHLIALLGTSRDEWWALPPEQRMDLGALGFALADRIGIDALRAAAKAGPVPADAVLELAGVRADGAGSWMSERVRPGAAALGSEARGEARHRGETESSGPMPAARPCDASPISAVGAHGPGVAGP